ncbi:N4-gp56 family major capsid protein [Paraburkholderia sp. BL18I3N2]|uniref:N4-gp56 family major capsid protein n=1 Tax=Paraburkholderia sp. BL18I3N2 TaxID=1938799 RepID=UPI000D06CCDD|nr:N4-gp56 family major capsid protein [Paraburkholderia sp. BL18I3N2]PRX32255.1 N4-gp56 family major capsid protein [Paraburkholderia sp. BL18I3N2]
MLTKITALLLGLLLPGVTNSSSSFTADVEAYIQEEVEPLARRQLVAYQFGKPLKLDSNRGTTYTASRYQRLPLPYAPLQEGVAPPGESMTLQQVSATAQQWGDRVIITDVANLTIKHPLFQQACELVALQMPETLERNTLNTLLSAPQVNYAGGVANRAALVAADVMSPHESNRLFASMSAYGVPRFNGDEREDMMIEAGSYRDPSKSPAVKQHYVALISPFSAQDMRENSSVQQAWAYSDVNRLYNNELGDFGGIRFVETNMMPYWTGAAQINGAASTSGGQLATGTYFIQVTAAPALTSVEQTIYQVSASLNVTGPTGSIAVTLPSFPNYVFNVYIGTTNSPSNLATAIGNGVPVTGVLAGQATQLQPGQTVTLTGVGVTQTPPAAPATGVSVFPVIFIGNHSYGQVLLENPEFHYLTGADKSDPLNQTRVVSWKVFYGSILLNTAFLARVECSSAFSPGYQGGTITTP